MGKSLTMVTIVDAPIRSIPVTNLDVRIKAYSEECRTFLNYTSPLDQILQNTG